MIVEYELPTLGVTVNPDKREGISIQVNHDQEAIINQAAPQVGISGLYFSREDIRAIMTAVNSLPGVTEGIPFNIKIREQGQTEVIQMYLNLLEGFTRSRDGLTASVKMLQSLDWLDDKVNAFNYESMYNETAMPSFKIDGITYSSYKQYFDTKQLFVPYVISSIPDYQNAFMALIALTYIGTELYRVGKDIQRLIVKITTNPFEWSGVAQLAVEILFAILLLASLVALINQLIQCLIQPIKYHGAMLVSDLMKVTAAKMGLQFSSTIWDTYPYNQIAFIPEKYAPVQAAPNFWNLLGFNVGGFAARGFTSPDPSQQRGYPNTVAGDFIRLAKRFCNAKLIIPDGTKDLVMERRDWFPGSPSYQLPDVRQDWNGYNFSELSATHKITFARDLNDKNCIDKYLGTVINAVHQQISTTNLDLVCLKGLRETNIPAARGIRKDECTFIENVVADIDVVFRAIADGFIAVCNAVIAVLNAIVAVINGIISLLKAITDTINAIIDVIPWDVDNITVFDHAFIDTIDYIPYYSLESNVCSSRKGALLVENDMLDVPKLVMIDISRNEWNDRIGYLHPSNQDVVNAKHISDNFYCIDYFADTPDARNGNKLVNNRYTKISPALNSESEKNPILINLRDFKKTVNNPLILDNFDEPVIIDSLIWYIERNGTADIEFRKKGWLRDPQNQLGAKRAQEIAINLQVAISENLMATNPATHLSQIMKGIEGFTKAIQSGEGLNIPADKMDEFKKVMAEKGVPEKLQELKDNINKMKEATKSMGK